MMRRILPVLLVLAACHKAKPTAPPPPAEPVRRTTTAAALDALPVLPVTDGRLLCLSNAENPCPAGSTTANWLHDGQFATWEPHRQILVWTPGKTEPMALGEIGPNEGQYDFVVSVAATRLGYIALNASGMRAIRYDGKGKFESAVPFPPVSVTHATGYSGDVPFYQVIHEAGRDSAAEFEVREIDTPGDTIGRTVLATKLDWLHIRDGRPVAALPLFPLLPAYTIAADSDVVWGTGDTFSVERRSAAGKLRWSLTSDATGPAVTKAVIDSMRKRLPDGATKAQRAHFDSSVAVTAKHHQAVGALYLAADGRVLAAGIILIARDSVKYIVLGNDGQPAGRFGLPRMTRVLLFGGDSLLVQRPGANADMELRWLRLKP